MKILPVNQQSKNYSNPACKANLWVDKSVQEVVILNKGTFENAAKMFDEWLQRDQANVSKTLQIRKNTSLFPKVAIEREESRVSYDYPHEESGYTVRKLVKKYEDLEFELGDKKCGFWFDPASNAQKLFSDFKNMFNYLNKN